MGRNADDTVIIRPPRARRPILPFVFVAILVVAAGAGGAAWLRLAPLPSPTPTIPTATEAELRVASPATRTVARFAPNPAIVVMDFPTLAEQGQMLNRMAAFEERAGLPHDRLLTDAELDAAILASGVTPETYYFGHDYRAAEIARFFALADQGHVALNPQELELRDLAAKIAAEPLGFGALITLTRADAANQVDASSRAVILHHELSHGEYFTNAVYSGFVKAVWETVLTEPERASFRSYLATEGYDTALEDLMMNETQAYLLHTPDPRFFDPSRLRITPARLAEIKDSFVAAMPSCWLRDETAAPPTPMAARY